MGLHTFEKKMNNKTMSDNLRGISIRYKIIVLLTALPIATLATYLLIAIGVFKDDKKAYVFDSSSVVARAISAQTKAQIGSLIGLARPIEKEFLKNQSLGGEAWDLLQNDPTFLGVQVFGGVTKESLAEIASKEKSQGYFDAIENKDRLPEWRSLTFEKNRLARVTSKGELIVFEKIGSSQSDQSMVFTYYFMVPELKELFQSPGANQLFLITTAGEVLFSPKNSKLKDLGKELGGEFIKNLKSELNTEGVSLLENGRVSKIISYARSGFGDLAVVSVVDKDLAFSAVGLLIKKSLLFFGLLICATIVISILATAQLTNSLTELFQATKRVASGQFDVQVPVQSKDEVGSLALGFNRMASEIDRLIKETEVKARMESELKTAQIVQNTLFPEAIAHLPGLSISGCYEPASECGGDWWHYCKIGKKYFLWIGDATGHGAPAALLTSAARSASTIIESLDVSPATAMNLLNSAIYDVARGNLMMTFFIASYDPETKVLTYCNASHEPPLLFKQQEDARTKNDIIPLIDANNPRIGQSKTTTYVETSIPLDENDQIVFYTDGVLDLRNENNKIMGERMFFNSLLKHVDNTDPEIVTKKLLETWNSFRKGTPLVDDLTFFVIKAEGGSLENT